MATPHTEPNRASMLSASPRQLSTRWLTAAQQMGAGQGTLLSEYKDAVEMSHKMLHGA